MDPTQATVPHPCPSCGETVGRVVHGHRGRIVACRRCGLVRRDPIPTADALAAIYRSPEYFRITSGDAIGYGDYYADEIVYRPSFRRALVLLERTRRPPGRLLEVGSAAGFALSEARDRGWDVEGLELAPDAVRFAREQLGLGARVHQGGIDDVPATGEHDVVMAFQTVEHFPDVRAALGRIRDALVPGGILLLTTPDHGSWARRLMGRFWPAYRPEHLLYFDRASIRAMLGATGFHVELITSDGPLTVPIRRLVERAAHYYSPWRVDPGWLPDWRIPVWLGDMLVIARRA